MTETGHWHLLQDWNKAWSDGENNGIFFKLITVWKQMTILATDNWRHAHMLYYLQSEDSLIQLCWYIYKFLHSVPYFLSGSYSAEM